MPPEWFGLFLRLSRFFGLTALALCNKFFFSFQSEGKTNLAAKSPRAPPIVLTAAARLKRLANGGKISTFWDTSHSNVCTVNVSPYVGSGSGFKAGQTSLDIYSADMRVTFIFWNDPATPPTHCRIRHWFERWGVPFPFGRHFPLISGNKMRRIQDRNGCCLNNHNMDPWSNLSDYCRALLLKNQRSGKSCTLSSWVGRVLVTRWRTCVASQLDPLLILIADPGHRKQTRVRKWKH